MSKPLVGIGVFVYNSQNQFLLGRRKGSLGADTWSLPGGHLEFGESFEGCATREVLEETGLVVRAVGFVTAVNCVMGSRHYVTIFMRASLGRPTDHPVVAEPDKCHAWEWVDWNQLRCWAERGTRDHDHDNHGRQEGTCRPLFMPLLEIFRQRPHLCPAGDIGL